MLTPHDFHVLMGVTRWMMQMLAEKTADLAIVSLSNEATWILETLWPIPIFALTAKPIV